jgi:hypothetical protein
MKKKENNLLEIISMKLNKDKNKNKEIKGIGKVSINV